MPTYYDTLGVDRRADANEIKKSYIRLARINHPDKAPPDQKEAATARFQPIGTAYATLVDPELKAAYDWLPPPLLHEVVAQAYQYSDTDARQKNKKYFLLALLDALVNDASVPVSRYVDKVDRCVAELLTRFPQAFDGGFLSLSKTAKLVAKIREYAQGVDQPQLNVNAQITNVQASEPLKVKIFVYGDQKQFNPTLQQAVFGKPFPGAGLNLVTDTLMHQNQQYDMQLWHKAFSRSVPLMPNAIQGANIVLVVANTQAELEQLLKQIRPAVTENQVLCVAVDRLASNQAFCVQEEVQSLIDNYGCMPIEFDLCLAKMLQQQDSEPLSSAMSKDGYVQMIQAFKSVEHTLRTGRAPSTAASASSALVVTGGRRDSLTAADVNGLVSYGHSSRDSNAK